MLGGIRPLLNAKRGGAVPRRHGGSKSGVATAFLPAAERNGHRSSIRPDALVDETHLCSVDEFTRHEFVEFIPPEPNNNTPNHGTMGPRAHFTQQFPLCPRPPAIFPR